MLLPQGPSGKGRVGVRKRSEAFNGLMLLFRLSHSGQTEPLDPEPVALGAVSKRGPRGNSWAVCGPGKWVIATSATELQGGWRGAGYGLSGEEGTGSAGISVTAANSQNNSEQPAMPATGSQLFTTFPEEKIR